MGKTIKLTTAEFIHRSKEKHGDRFDYSLSVYVNRDEKVSIRCIEHDYVFKQIAGNHMLGFGACVQCGYVKLDTTEFIRRSNIIHKNKFDYSNSIWVNSKTDVDIICPTHGPFQQNAFKHMTGDGCKYCSGTFKKTTTQFIEEAITVHGKAYDYSLVDYTNNHTCVNIICPVHGVFSQTPINHLWDKGCSSCADLIRSGKIRRTIWEFISLSNETHGGKYYYLLSKYVDCKTKTIVVCSKHGDFLITPDNHIRGWGCPDCYKRSNLSKPEKEWIRSLNIPSIIEQHSISIPEYHKRALVVDGFDPKTNTVYEFNGDWWHGNPKYYQPDKTHPINHKTYGELYDTTIRRGTAITAAGYNLISIWESDYNLITKTAHKSEQQ
jgi:hypothetical protein